MADAPRYYAFDPKSGQYLGWDFARPDPLEVGRYLFPANTTKIAPPAESDHLTACFLNGTWRLVSDHRGTTWYRADGRRQVVLDLGDPAMFGLVAEAPPDAGPKQAVTRLDGQWALVPDRRGEFWYDAAGKPVLIEAIGDPGLLGLTASAPDLRGPAEKLADAKAEARSELYDLLEHASRSLVAGYPLAEVLGWAEKGAEAAAVLANPALGVAPILEAECNAEADTTLGGAPLLAAVQARAKLVQAKAENLTAATGRLAGVRRRASGLIDGAGNIEDVTAIMQAVRSELA